MSGSVPNIEEVGELVSPPELDRLRNQVKQLLEVRTDRFPAAQPVSFSRKHIKALKTRDYFVCEKSDGIRCLLYFAKTPSRRPEEETHYLIDRKNNYYQVRGLHFPRTVHELSTFHEDTLLDGELVWDRERDGTRMLKYLVFDCMVVDGRILMHRTLDKRLAFFLENILTPYQELCSRYEEDCRSFVFRLEKKETQRAYGITVMFQKIIPNLKHGSDGLIFTCRESPYVFGTDENILKWKPAEENTIDFKLDLRFPSLQQDKDTSDSVDDDQDTRMTMDGEQGPSHGQRERNTRHERSLGLAPAYDYSAMPEFVLHLNGGEREPDREFGTLYMTTVEWEKLKGWSMRNDEGLDGVIVECHLDEHKRWRFNRIREDKAEANHFSVAEKVMDSIRDGVNKDDLDQAVREIRDAWKAREAAVS